MPRSACEELGLMGVDGGGRLISSELVSGFGATVSDFFLEIERAIGTDGDRVGLDGWMD